MLALITILLLGILLTYGEIINKTHIMGMLILLPIVIVVKVFVVLNYRASAVPTVCDLLMICDLCLLISSLATIVIMKIISHILNK